MIAAKSTLFVALFAASAQLVTATPPGCLIAAINTPWDISLLCGAHSGAIQGQIKQQCNTKEETDAAMQAYKETCASAGKTVSTSSGSDSSSTKSSTATATGSSTGSGVTTSSSATGSSAPYPIVYTSTYYDTVCSCTKTAAVSSTAVVGPSGFATGTGAAGPTGTGSGTVTGGASGSGVASGPSATGSPITPVGPKGTGSAGFTGAATKTVGSFAAVALAAFALALSL
ncbi:MAG: hypothetical protein Q9228_005677 [Teloschistes exilis]